MIDMQYIMNIKKIRSSWCPGLISQNYLFIFVTLLFLLLTILLPSYLLAKETDFYTVQTGSFTTEALATKQFNSLSTELDNGYIDNLRIEKNGKYYVVRLGIFNGYSEANEFLQAKAIQLKGSIIVETNFNKESIVKQNIFGIEAKSANMPVQPMSSEKIVQTDSAQIKPQKSTVESPENSTNNYNVLPEKNSAKKTNKKSQIKGRFYISDYYSNDSNNFDFHVLSARMKVYMRENDDSRYYFKIDARARKKASDNDVHNDIPEYKFYEAWIGYKFPDQKIDLIAGRQHVHDMYNTSVDGINAKYQIRDDLGMGIFAGLTPDKYDYSFNSKFKTLGIYSFMDRVKYKLRFGYERLYYDGNTDREYFSFKMFSTPTEKTRFNVLSSASINQLTNNVDIDNLSATLIYKYSRDLRFNAFFNYYSVIRYFESAKKFFAQNGGSDSYYIDPNSQSRIGLRVNYRIRKKLTLYASMAYQKRESDDDSATRFTGGFRKYDLYGFDMSGRYTRINNFTSKSNEFNVEVSRFLLEKFDLSVYASHEQEELEIENGFTSGLLTYGASVYWSINKHYFASMFIERYDEDDYDNTSVFTQAGYRF